MLIGDWFTLFLLVPLAGKSKSAEHKYVLLSAHDKG